MIINCWHLILVRSSNSIATFTFFFCYISDLISNHMLETDSLMGMGAIGSAISSIRIWEGGGNFLKDLWIVSSVHDLVWPPIIGQSFWPPLPNLKNWRIKNQLNIGMLHIKWKLKTEVLQWKYVQTSKRSNEWPQTDLHWPPMTSKLSILEPIHDV